MNRTSQVLRRLGVTGLAAVAFASPLLFALPAQAAPGTVTLQDPMAVPGASYRNDGTNTTVHLYATITQATAGDPQISFVRFTQQMIVPTAAPTPTTICDDSTAPYSCEWQPSANGTYTITAEAHEANGTLIDSSSQTVPVSDISSSVHFTRPTEGGPVGYNPTTGLINVGGTRSSDFPTITVDADGGTGASAAGTGQQWATDVGSNGGTGFTNPNGGPNSFPTGDTGTGTRTIQNLRATTSGGATGDSDEDIPATVYLQKLTTFTVTPTSQSAQPGGTPVRYTVQANDQKGNPVSGLRFSITKNAGSSAALSADDTGTAANGGDYAGPAPAGDTPNTCPNVTDPNGRFRFKASDPAAEQTTFTITSYFANNGGPCTKDPAVDFQVTAILNTLQNSASGTVSIVPNLPIYDTVRYGQDPPGVETDYPVVKVRVNDQNGQPIISGPSGVVYQKVRTYTYCGNGVTVNATNCGVPANPETTTASPGNTDANGDVQLPIDPAVALDSAGSDVYTVYIEKNGTPGFQSGDTAVATVSLKFGPPRIFFRPCDQQTFSGASAYQTQVAPSDCDQAAQAGQNTTVSILYTIFDGTNYIPVANHAIDLTITNPVGLATGEYGFTTTQPSGSVRNSATSDTVTTDANGVGSATLSASKVGTVDLLASDPSLGTAVIDDATSTIDFRNYQAVLNTAANAGNDFQITPTDFFGGANVGSPGAPLLSQVTLKDQNGAILINRAVTLTTTAGFFTPLPKRPDYAALTFDTPPVNNASVTGNLKNLGKTFQTTTDANGDVYFALGILRDAGFDDDGIVKGTVSATMGGATIALPTGQNGPNGSGAAPSTGGVLFSTDSDNFGVTSVNAATTNALEIRKGTIDNAGKFHLGTGKPGGDVATARDNGIPTDIVSFVIFQRDVFGNLINDDDNQQMVLSSSGPGTLSQTQPDGAYTNVEGATAPGCGGGHSAITEICNGGSANPQTGLETVTVDWPAPNTTFIIGNDGVADTNNNTRTISDSFQLNWYLREASGLHFSTLLTPASAQNNGTAPTGTTIGVSVTVTDVKGRAVQGLPVQFLTSGPGANTTQSNACNAGLLNPPTFTDVSGRAGYQYASNTPGRSNITTIVDDTSCNEIGRDVRVVTFTGDGTPPAASGTVTINGPQLPSTNRVPVGDTVSVSGTADSGALVHVYFRKRGASTFSDLRKVTATGGVWSTTFRALDDYRYFAAVGSGCPATLTSNTSSSSTVNCVTSRIVLTQAVPNLDGPQVRTVKKGSRVSVSGNYVVGTPALLLFTVGNNVVKSANATVARNGVARFAYTFTADRDYRIYIVRNARDQRQGLLSWVVQAR
jgi:hypothetical protein